AGSGRPAHAAPHGGTLPRLRPYERRSPPVPGGARRCHARRGRRRRRGSSPASGRRSFGGLLLVDVAALAAAELGGEGRPLEPEEPGRGLLVPLGSPEGLLDEPVLELLDCRVQVEPLLAEGGAGDLLLRDERAEARRQVLDADVAVLREDDEAFEQVLQLAYVPGPVVLPEVDHRLFGDQGGASGALAVVLLEEVSDEERDVRAPLAQRRHHDRDDLKPVEQVLPEVSG